MTTRVPTRPSLPSPWQAPELVNRPRVREQNELQCAGEVNVLILDDDPVVCHLMRDSLNGKGYNLDTVSDPAQMQAQLQHRAYHLILMDYVIPSLTPDQVFGWVQQYQPEASIIVVTGYPSMDSALNCLRARTYDYLTKPFNVTQLQEVVERCLESKGLLRLSEDALREALGVVIRERRKSLGLTLAQLAERTKVSLGYLSQIELGKNSASIETLYRISLGLGIKLAELFHAVEQRW